MNRGLEKENNIQALEKNHEVLKQKAKEMFEDLDLDDEFEEKKEFTAT